MIRCKQARKRISNKIANAYNISESCDMFKYITDSNLLYIYACTFPSLKAGQIAIQAKCKLRSAENAVTKKNKNMKDRVLE